jgi:nucleotide-binding universal stress UspA family protein
MNVQMSALSTIKHVLVATDFSENAALALRWAIAALKGGRGSISLVHALDSHAIGKASLQTVSQEISQHLQVAGDPARQAGLAVDEHFEAGKPWKVVTTFAEKLKVDLIVLGTHGQSSLGDYVLGSTADRVIRIANVPVLAVHPRDQVPQKQTLRVLVPHDLSKQAEAAANAAVMLLSQLGGGQVTLFNVCELMIGFTSTAAPSFDQAFWDRCEADARKELEQVAGTLKRDQIEIAVKTARGMASSSIVEQAKSMKADFIAMGTHGGSAVHQLLIGSVAERVLQTAPCPVLTVRTAS